MQEHRNAGESFRAWRGSRTQVEIGALFGVTDKTISALETGRVFPSLKLARRIEELARIPASSWVAAGSAAIEPEGEAVHAS